MVNKVILVGRLGQDPETRTTGGGMTVANLSVATNEKRKDGDNWVDHTEWHRVVCFGKLAENAARYLAKGREVYVEGKIRTEKWTDKDGVDRYTTKIYADNLTFLAGGRSDEQSGGERQERPRSTARASSGGGGDW